ncbi:MAG TPA: SgcJ/EcaC family oxidoreductase [Pseudonocardiaceae bacterium]
MSNKAASLVAQAKQWATYYGGFTQGEEAAVYTAPLRVRAAWDNNDADALADVFIDNGSLLDGDEQLNGREAIRAYMTEAFRTHHKGTKVIDQPLEIRKISQDVAIAISDGGIVPEGATEIPPTGKVRVMWVVVRQDGDWKLASYQSSPVKG